MTREEFLGAYNIGHRDGKEGDYLPNDYDDIFHIEESNTDVLDKIRAEIEDLEPTYNFEGFYECQSEVIEIIDKAIKEAADDA